jgi:hypothetical protein
VTTRLTDQVLANVHGDMRRNADIDPMNNMFMAEVLNRMDDVTVNGYDADAAAASLFAYASVLRTAQLATTVDATLSDIVEYLASMATLTGQALHAHTHATGEEPEPMTYSKPQWLTEEPEEWRNLPRSAPQTITFDTVPWPPDRRETLPTVIVGQRPEPYMLEAVRQFRSVRGHPVFINVITLTAAQVNEAVTWWNHRAAMLRMEQP